MDTARLRAELTAWLDRAGLPGPIVGPARSTSGWPGTLVLDGLFGSASTLPAETGAELLARGGAHRLLEL